MTSTEDTSMETDSKPQDTSSTETQLNSKSVNTNPFSVEQNLIDLNTPNTPLKGSANGLSNVGLTDVTEGGGSEEGSLGGPDLLSGEPCLTGESVSPGDQTLVHKSSSSYSNSTSNFGGTGSEQNSLYVSHTESGYLTDSVTSHISHERHPSISGSEADKTPSHETRPSSSSENDITPCTEKLFALSDSLARLSTPSNGPEKHTDHSHGRRAKSEKLIDFDNGIPKTRLDLLTHIDSNCDRKSGDADGNVRKYSSNSRPESLILLNAVQDQEQGNKKQEFDVIAGKTYGHHFNNVEKCENRKRSKSSGFPIPRLKEGADISEDGLSKSLPQGQLMKSNTGMFEFVADDLMEKIRRSSPMSKTASSDVSSRRSSQLSLTSIDSFNSSTMATSMTSGMSVSYPQSPDCIPPIDPMAIHEIEIQARTVADGLDLMMGNLRSNLHKMSAITVGCEEAYRTSVAVTCDSVDSSIKSMYALMAKCEELSSKMQPIYKLADQIKEIKRLLDRFEHQLADKP